jgi:Transposase IS66 family
MNSLSPSAGHTTAPSTDGATSGRGGEKSTSTQSFRPRSSGSGAAPSMGHPRTGALHRRSGTVRGSVRLRSALTYDVAQAIRSEPQECAQEHGTENGGRKGASRAMHSGPNGRSHVLAAERLHGDDTTVPILAKGKTIKGHIWTYVRDDRPFAGRAPPAALYYASRDRRHEHPAQHLRGFIGILQADAYAWSTVLRWPPITDGTRRTDVIAIGSALLTAWTGRVCMGAILRHQPQRPEGCA